MNSCVIIPARFRSTRFEGKPLVNLAGKPLVIWVVELAIKAVGKENVFVATDHEKIHQIVNDYGYKSINTSSNCLTGTDRVAEASRNLNYDIFVNVQGDEPLVNPKDIVRCIELKMKEYDYVINSFCSILNHEEINSLNVPKVVTSESNELIYISRSVIPRSKNNYLKSQIHKRQVCIYGFSKEDLMSFYNFGRKSTLENIEDIEILRFFELNKKIKMFEASNISHAVDIPEDVKKVEKILINKKMV